MKFRAGGSKLQVVRIFMKFGAEGSELQPMSEFL